MSAVIECAAKHGAKFRQAADGQWVAENFRRGRSLPLAMFLDPSKEAAAAMYLKYFNVKIPA